MGRGGERSVPRVAVSILGSLLGVAIARAHVDPPTCASAGLAVTVTGLRADGKTGLAGAVSECERILYRVTVRTIGESCAVSGGTLVLVTPDHVEHVLAAPLPCIGGTVAEDGGGAACTPGVTEWRSGPVAYDVRPGDAVNDVLSATARLAGIVTHDVPGHTRGAAVSTDRRVSLTRCDDADPCTDDLCDPSRPAAAACTSVPRCDDGDPTTADECVAGRCTFTPMASSARDHCGR